MGSPAYIRFENTFRALVDCAAHLNDELSSTETDFKNLLIDTCESIVETERGE